jgi:hypothetical protein
LAKKFEVEEWLVPACVALVEREDSLNYGEAEMVGLEMTVLLSEAREKYLRQSSGSNLYGGSRSPYMTPYDPYGSPPKSYMRSPRPYGSLADSVYGGLSNPTYVSLSYAVDAPRNTIYSYNPQQHKNATQIVKEVLGIK